MNETKREAWQRGPINGVPALLQPVAHALVQANEEAEILLKDLPAGLLWQEPAGLASPAFHLQHMTGVTDRLFTYAKGDRLSEEQLASLAAEGRPDETITAAILLDGFSRQVQKAIAQLQDTGEQSLTDARGIGRAQIPSTVIGLLFHAAEHTMRHLGQLLVTVNVLKAGAVV